MKNWNELQNELDRELEQNLSELQKMIEIYDRVGMTAQSLEIRQIIEKSKFRHTNPRIQNNQAA